MAHYTNVTKQDVESFLFPQGFQQITVEGATELVYAKRVDRDGKPLSLRVYTGINPSGNSRGVGEDAMRVTLFWRNPQGEIRLAGGSKRVHRVEGWRKNLQSRIDAWEELIGPPCPQCGSPMVERNGKFGKFYGCSDYPNCKCTKPLEDKPLTQGSLYTPSAAEIQAEREMRSIEAQGY